MGLINFVYNFLIIRYNELKYIVFLFNVKREGGRKFANKNG